MDQSREEAYEKGDTPDYYTGQYMGIKVKDILNDFNLSNRSHYKSSALEYILRSGHKDDERQDILKAINHLQMEIERIDLHSGPKMEGEMVKVDLARFASLKYKVGDEVVIKNNHSDNSLECGDVVKVYRARSGAHSPYYPYYIVERYDGYRCIVHDKDLEE